MKNWGSRYRRTRGSPTWQGLCGLRRWLRPREYREVTRKLTVLGCHELPRTGRGSHRKWLNPVVNQATVVPNWGSRDLKLGTIRGAVRQLGLDWRAFSKRLTFEAVMHVDRSHDARKAPQQWSDKLLQPPPGSGGGGKWIILGALLASVLVIGLTVIAFLALQDQREEAARAQATQNFRQMDKAVQSYLLPPGETGGASIPEYFSSPSGQPMW